MLNNSWNSKSVKIEIIIIVIVIRIITTTNTTTKMNSICVNIKCVFPYKQMLKVKLKKYDRLTDNISLIIKAKEKIKKCTRKKIINSPLSASV